MNASHIVLVISSLAMGGAERVIADMATHFVGGGRRVTLLTLAGDMPDVYPIPLQVERVRVDIMWSSRNFRDSAISAIRRLVLIRRTIRSLDPSVVVSFIDMTNVRVLVALLGTKIPVIVSERVNPLLHPIGRFWAIARRFTYSIADAVVLQTPDAARWAKRWVRKNRIVVIPNAVRGISYRSDGKRPVEMPEGPVILAMGRLVPQKGFDLLLRAFSSVMPQCREWRLVILGDGPEGERLRRLALQLGLTSRVFFPGSQSNPADWLKCASLFVLPSRYEGFPNVLLEAMQYGLPVVAFECASGPSEIIRHGIDGLLVPSEDSSAMALAISRLANDKGLRISLGARATEIADRFPQDKIYSSWLSLCDSLSEGVS